MAFDGGLDVNTNGDVVGGIDSNIGQCLGLGHIVEVKEADTCPHWEGDPPDNQRRARLEAGVVQAALAERRLRDPEVASLAIWYTALTAYNAAVGELLAFLGEGGDGK
jgi:hypothetical protein